MKQDHECIEFGLVNCYSKKTISKIAKSAFKKGDAKRLNFSSICDTCQGKALCSGFHALLFRSGDRLTEDCQSVTLCTNMSWQGFIRAVKTIINFQGVSGKLPACLTSLFGGDNFGVCI